MNPYYQDGLNILYNDNAHDCYKDLCEAYKPDLIVLDPPFELWKETPLYDAKSIVCFTTFKHRHHVEMRYGEPRMELIWHFRDGRWTSHKLPRTTHETILYYGQSGEAYVGERQDQTPQKKGKGSIGVHKMEDRVYKPRANKALNSVLCYPRNVSNPYGCWGKPVRLMEDLIKWSGARVVFDPYAGSGTTGRACSNLGVHCIMVEQNKDACDMIVQRVQGTLALLTHEHINGTTNTTA